MIRNLIVVLTFQLVSVCLAAPVEDDPKADLKQLRQEVVRLKALCYTHNVNPGAPATSAPDSPAASATSGPDNSADPTFKDIPAMLKVLPEKWWDEKATDLQLTEAIRGVIGKTICLQAPVGDVLATNAGAPVLHLNGELDQRGPRSENMNWNATVMVQPSQTDLGRSLSKGEEVAVIGTITFARRLVVPPPVTNGAKSDPGILYSSIGIQLNNAVVTPKIDPKATEPELRKEILRIKALCKANKIDPGGNLDSAGKPDFLGIVPVLAILPNEIWDPKTTFARRTNLLTEKLKGKVLRVQGNVDDVFKRNIGPGSWDTCLSFRGDMAKFAQTGGPLTCIVNFYFHGAEEAAVQALKKGDPISVQGRIDETTVNNLGAPGGGQKVTVNLTLHLADASLVKKK